MALTPAQERTLSVLRRSGEPVVFDGHDIDELVADTRAALADAAERMGDGNPANDPVRADVLADWRKPSANTLTLYLVSCGEEV
jgi:hypothetical protein